MKQTMVTTSGEQRRDAKSTPQQRHVQHSFCLQIIGDDIHPSASQGFCIPFFVKTPPARKSRSGSFGYEAVLLFCLYWTHTAGTGFPFLTACSRSLCSSCAFICSFKLALPGVTLVLGPPALKSSLSTPRSLSVLSSTSEKSFGSARLNWNGSLTDTAGFVMIRGVPRRLYDAV
jgi:hypothetical protein